jgi:hypothetical protein
MAARKNVIPQLIHAEKKERVFTNLEMLDSHGLHRRLRKRRTDFVSEFALAANIAHVTACKPGEPQRTRHDHTHTLYNSDILGWANTVVDLLVGANNQNFVVSGGYAEISHGCKGFKIKTNGRVAAACVGNVPVKAVQIMAGKQHRRNTRTHRR